MDRDVITFLHIISEHWGGSRTTSGVNMYVNHSGVRSKLHVKVWGGGTRHIKILTSKKEGSLVMVMYNLAKKGDG